MLKKAQSLARTFLECRFSTSLCSTFPLLSPMPCNVCFIYYKKTIKCEYAVKISSQITHWPASMFEWIHSLAAIWFCDMYTVLSLLNRNSTQHVTCWTPLSYNLIDIRLYEPTVITYLYFIIVYIPTLVYAESNLKYISECIPRSSGPTRVSISFLEPVIIVHFGFLSLKLNYDTKCQNSGKHFNYFSWLEFLFHNE